MNNGIELVFEATIEAFTGEVDGNDDWAIYPYNASNTSDGSSVTATLSANQTACAETIADNPMVDYSSLQGLGALIPCGLCRFPILSIASSINVEVDASRAFGLIFAYYSYGETYDKSLHNS